jgi:3-hydroxyisobutyrate dehydrogenase-like beta-hydroxyacid dehydrogenase
MRPVGLIGAGSMGGPMAERLLAAGHPVHLYARRQEVADRFARLGAVIEPSVAAVARAVGVLVLCPFSEEQLTEITDGPEGVLAHARTGTVVLQHATVSPQAVESLAMRAAARGVTVLDAPISGRADDVRAGRLTVLVGGDEDAFAAAGPVLGCYGGTVLHTGPVGAATAVKLVNNLVFAAHVQVAAAALELGHDLGLAQADLLAGLSACSGASTAIGILREVGDLGAFVASAGPYLRKDVAAAAQAARGRGVSTGALGAAARTGPVDLAGEPPGARP